MVKVRNVSTEQYMENLTAKGFIFKEDARGFINFGKHYTGCSDLQVNLAIEITLMAQKEFDGSFFISILESMQKERVQTKKAALEMAKMKAII